MRFASLVVTTVVTTVVLMLPARAASAQTQPSGDALTPLQTAMACAPPLPADVAATSLLRVVGPQTPEPRMAIGTRDLVVVDGGSGQGVAAGQEYFVRRIGTYSAGMQGDRKHALRTTGWVKVVSADEHTAIAAVEHACGPILADDYLEPFVPPAPPDDAEAVDRTGELDFSSPARVLYGNEEHHNAAVGDFVLIDQGTDQGAAPGGRFAFYRDPRVPGLPLATIGEGVVVAASASASLVRVNESSGEIRSGDYLVRRK